MYIYKREGGLIDTSDTNLSIFEIIRNFIFAFRGFEKWKC